MALSTILNIVLGSHNDGIFASLATEVIMSSWKMKIITTSEVIFIQMSIITGRAMKHSYAFIQEIGDGTKWAYLLFRKDTPSRRGKERSYYRTNNNFNYHCHPLSIRERSPVRLLVLTSILLAQSLILWPPYQRKINIIVQGCDDDISYPRRGHPNEKNENI